MQARPLYQRILGSAWDDLAPQIRELHSVRRESVFTGRCRVERGRSPLSRLVASVIGFPKAGTDQNVSVTLTVDGDGERWIRRIGDHRFSSLQRPGQGRSDSLIRERFGPVSVHMALVVALRAVRLGPHACRRRRQPPLRDSSLDATWHSATALARPEKPCERVGRRRHVPVRRGDPPPAHRAHRALSGSPVAAVRDRCMCSVPTAAAYFACEIGHSSPSASHR